MKTVDIVVPMYNEEDVLPLYYTEIYKVIDSLPNYHFRLLFVDDGSSDGTLKMLKQIAKVNEDAGYVSFSRNFGKESAIYAGLKYATADIIILMDGDLEHPPELIPEMLDALEEGYEACGAKRYAGFASNAFASINNKMSNVKLKKGATDYMCMSRRFVRSVLRLSETQRFSKGLFAWVGYNVKWIDYSQEDFKRPKGSSKWNFKKLFNYASDGLTSFSTTPLRAISIVGFVVCIIAFIYIIVQLIVTLVTGIDVPGYTSTLVIMLFLGGLILLAIGILGEYIGKIYLESKDRPMYILGQTNLKKRDEDEY